MSLQLFEAGDVISRKGHGGKKTGARYPAYTKGVAKHLDWLKEQIAASKDVADRIKLSDFAKECGMTMKKVVDGAVVEGSAGLAPVSVGWGFKYALYHAGIVYNAGKVEDGQPVMIMRLKTEGDELPKSLQEKTVDAGAVVTENEGAEQAGQTA